MGGAAVPKTLGGRNSGGGLLCKKFDQHLAPPQPTHFHRGAYSHVYLRARLCLVRLWRRPQAQATSRRTPQKVQRKAAGQRPRPTDVAQTPMLPVTLNAKLGLAVASADLQPLVLVVASDAAARAALEAKVAKLAWSKDFEGFFTYVNAANTKALVLTSAINNGAANTSSSNAANTSVITKDSVLIIEPDIFGAAGKIVAQISASDVDTQLSSAMKSAQTNHVRMEKSREQLKRMALAQGIYFETGIPVSGKREAEDRAKYKQQLDARKKAL